MSAIQDIPSGEAFQQLPSDVQSELKAAAQFVALDLPLREGVVYDRRKLFARLVQEIRQQGFPKLHAEWVVGWLLAGGRGFEVADPAAPPSARGWSVEWWRCAGGGKVFDYRARWCPSWEPPLGFHQGAFDGAPAPKPAPGAPGEGERGRKINEKVLGALLRDADLVTQPVRFWADLFDCSIASVQKTAAWGHILGLREKMKAETSAHREKERRPDD